MKKINLQRILKIIELSLFLGYLSGVLGALFSKCISIVTNIRSQNNWLIYFLPIAGLLIIFIYNKLNVFAVGTNQVIENCTNREHISPLLIPAIFIGSVISHLFGASVGREGAALQLGGGLSSLFTRIYRIDNTQKQILTQCGMAGLFSAVFGTPIAAALFALQIVYVWRFSFKAIIPVFISSYTAYFTAINIGSIPERFSFSEIPKISLSVLLKSILISILSALLAMLFCYSLRWSEKLFKKLFNNVYTRIAIGGIITVFLTLLIKSNDYNGAGVNIIEEIFENGKFENNAFFLKIIFTCIAIASGYKGGEIIPSLFIGATFGSLIASLIGLPLPLGAVIGMTALFCGVTNCTFAAIFLSLEMFSGKGLIYILLAAFIATIFSGKVSIYSAQKIAKPTEIFNIKKTSAEKN